MMNSGGHAKQHSEGWQLETLFEQASEYFEHLLAGIDSAEVSIDLAVYIFELDQVGHRVLAALQAAAERGVKVRLLVDGVGSAVHARQIAQALTGSGGHFHIFHPLPWYWQSFRWSLKRGGWLDKFWYLLGKVNRRDHRKFMLVDSQRAWCGNFNICESHLGEKFPWHDYGVYLEGVAVGHLEANFNQVWSPETDVLISKQSFKHCLSNTSRRLRRVKNRYIAEQIRSAKERVWICSAYFSPSGIILRAIRAARQRDVEVRLIVAGRSDIFAFPLLTASYYSDLLRMGVKVYQYEAAILHAKTLLIDQQCIIGSSNFNFRSLYHDLELDVIIVSPASIETMEKWLRRDMRGCHRVDSHDVSIWHRNFWLGWIPRLLRYWM